MTIARLQDYVTRQADRRPGATALVLGDQTVTYQELETGAQPARAAPAAAAASPAIGSG